ncbi:sigma factor-like helix-turn-helix DNA-binding protein [Yonghaparkia sp. Root332]|uniref:sigma factor-like helix-turn-helix DNA-binding protein n=1 Tax=Yonghaparkia sp. Root332 TaxID=1736516 RepID=UPI0006F403A0|nr:sigma factor-like helix-turn-helix DNA-binding protein [Yonghaparkia sp. Root332]KQV24814.1 hypothetical protein ASC54_09965 [Yonghaparkia sp. Root332]
MDASMREQDMVFRRALGESLDSIGKSYGVSRERVRQIIVKAGGPTAQDAHRAARSTKSAEGQREREAFAAQYLPIARELASKGTSRRDVIARLKAIDPSIDEVMAGFVLRKARIVFAQDWVDDFMSNRLLVAAVWFLFGLDYQIPADPSLAIKKLDHALISELTEVLARQGVHELERARVLGVIAAAQNFATENPGVSITAARYGVLRKKQVVAWGLESARGTHFWPPTRQAAMARFGGWSETLLRVGLKRSEFGRSKGFLKYTADEYQRAAMDYVAWADRRDATPSVDRYKEWRRLEANEGRERPSGASLRNIFGSWSKAMRAARESADHAGAHALQE